MVRGLYSSANGLLVGAARTDVIAANLAGLSVPAYRRDIPTVSVFEQTLTYTALAGDGGPVAPPVVLVPETQVDLQPGQLHHTGGRLDFALDGPGYFCVQTPRGEAYTRSGAFRLDASHYLLTSAGDRVLGQAGPIRIEGGQVEALENGDLLVDGARVDRLRLVAFPAGAEVQKLGRGLLWVDGPVTAADSGGAVGRVRQGHLEQANVNAVTELAAMISALRAFEASQRALQATDETLAKVINEVGRV